ncbi:4Fe-4S dicluster domain-containing protein [Chloroflexota bacterium]
MSCASIARLARLPASRNIIFPLVRDGSQWSLWAISFMPRTCLHCGKPPCADVCPTGDIEKREDGIVRIDRELCIGRMS